MTLARVLRASASLHTRLCPRQVLGARMALLAARELGLKQPRRGRRLLAIVETDGCFADAVSVATGCTVGRRTLRVEDFGKVAATFVDVETGNCLRVAPHARAREVAPRYAPRARSRWEAMLLGYRTMPDAELLTWRWVELVVPLSHILGESGVRVRCARCGEEVNNRREVTRKGRVLCRSCADGGYWCPARGRRRPAPVGPGGRRSTPGRAFEGDAQGPPASADSNPEERSEGMTRPDRRKLAAAWWIGVLLVGGLLGITPDPVQGQAQPEPSQEEGRQLFEVRCVACHTIGGGVRIGPDLQGVTGRRDVSWMKRFIGDPDRVRGEGDSISAANLGRYGIPMPNLGLTEQQVDAVVAYLGTAEKAPMPIPAPYVPTLVLGGLAIAGLTLIALTVGTKRVEIRP